MLKKSWICTRQQFYNHNEFCSFTFPIFFQVSRLVIIHEEGEAGHEMPDLSRPVQAVSKAVTNLVKVRFESAISTEKFHNFIVSSVIENTIQSESITQSI